MKCNEAEKQILLKDSGELSDRYFEALETHVDTCVSCRRFAQLLAASNQVANLASEPSAISMQNVLRAARVNAPEKKKHASFFGYKPALASLASVVLLIGVLMGNINNNKIGMELFVTAAQLLDPEDQVVSVMYEGLSEDDLAFNFLMTYEDKTES